MKDLNQLKIVLGTARASALDSATKVLIRAAVLGCALCANAALPKYEVLRGSTPRSEYGDITRYSVRSETLKSDVIVDIWTPKGYDSSSMRRYPVVYAHDGQNLFYSSFSFSGVAWEVEVLIQEDRGAMYWA